MVNTLIRVSYDGTNYGGFQLQKNAPTIQEALERALAIVYKEPVRVSGAGRTDAGVHARGQAAGFQAPFSIQSSQLPFALNALLPADIVVTAARVVRPGFHPRFEARRKVYSYTLDRSDYPQVMRRLYSLHLPGPFSLGPVEEAARILEGEQDFRAFTARVNPVKSTRRTLYRVSVEKRKEDLVVFIFEGNGFLYRMARLISGSLIRVGQEKIGPAAVTRALAGTDFSGVGPTAPAHALCLERVVYEDL